MPGLFALSFQHIQHETNRPASHVAGLPSEVVTMVVDKREMRKLKREIKKTGNRRRRRFLKDVHAEADEFDFGLDRSDVMNERKPRRPQDDE